PAPPTHVDLHPVPTRRSSDLADRIEKWGPDWRDLDLGIETRESVHKRGMDFVKDMSERYPEAHLLVVSHGILIKETVNGLLEEKDRKSTRLNSSHVSISYAVF